MLPFHYGPIVSGNEHACEVPIVPSQIAGVGCVVQVTTQQGDNVSEALTFVPGVKIACIGDDKANGRLLVPIEVKFTSTYDIY